MAFDANGCEIRVGDFVRYVGQGPRWDRWGWVLDITEIGSVRWGQDMRAAIDVLWTDEDGIRRSRNPKRTRVSARNCLTAPRPCPPPRCVIEDMERLALLNRGMWSEQPVEDIDIPVRVRRSAMLERAEGKIRQAAETIQVAALEPYEIDVAEVGDIVLIEGETRRHRLVVVSQEWAGEALKAEDV